MMKQKEAELQHKYHTLAQQPAAPEEWKMKKFQGIESKVSNIISGRDQPKANYQPLSNLNIESQAADLPPKPMNKAQLIKLRVQQEQQQRHAIDAAPIVQVYEPDSKPNAVMMPDRAPVQQRQFGKENLNYAKPEQRYTSNEPVYMESSKPRQANQGENIYALANKKPSV